MKSLFRKECLLPVSLCLCAQILAAGPSSNAIAPKSAARSPYFWQTISVGNTAELVTLLCRGCNAPSAGETNIPLVAVLRDTLGDTDPANDRLTSVWLLTYSRPNIGQRVLSGIPFFYWHVSDASVKTGAKGTAPLLDLNAPQHPVFNTVGHDILQWTMLDPAATPIRAVSRAYRSNEVDRERLHLEEAITYLRSAPSGPDAVLTPRQMNTLIARLELRKTLLGGFVKESAAARFGEEENIRQESIRSRNWELLRQCADKTGLYFEPLSIAGTSAQYAMLWLPEGQCRPEGGTRLGPIWKLLNIKDPWRVKSPGAPAYSRDVDENGNLLPFGITGVKQVKLVPLSVYSLNYPKLPLLMIDFRNRLHIKWHEVTQRSINEITAGVIGISHFTNWYYYAAADLYDFIASRHGAAMNQSERLDCYSQFRVSLQLDNQLDPELRREMQQRVDTLAVNPLESAPNQEMAAALERYNRLQTEAESGRLLARIEKDRRAELAQYSESQKHRWCDYTLHLLSLGTYTHRAKSDAGQLAELDNNRRAQRQLDFLAQLSAAGTPPEISYDTVRIQHSIAELRELMSEVTSQQMRLHAASTLKRVRELSRDPALQDDCSSAVAAIEAVHAPGEPSQPDRDGRVALRPATLHAPSANPAQSNNGLDGLR